MFRPESFFTTLADRENGVPDGDDENADVKLNSAYANAPIR